MLISRAKQKSNGKWVKGWPFKIGEKVYMPRSDAKVETDLNDYSWVGGIVEVIPDTVSMQTGIQDKNKVDVYLGDSVMHDDGYVGVVKWSSKKACVYFEWDDGQKSYPLEYYDYQDFVVIDDSQFLEE